MQVQHGVGAGEHSLAVWDVKSESYFSKLVRRWLKALCWDPGTSQASIQRRVTGDTNLVMWGMIENIWRFLLEEKRLKGVWDWHQIFGWLLYRQGHPSPCPTPRGHHLHCSLCEQQYPELCRAAQSEVLLMHVDNGFPLQIGEAPATCMSAQFQQEPQNSWRGFLLPLTDSRQRLADHRSWMCNRGF